MATEMATDKQKVLILKMCEAHFNVKVFEFTIYRGKPSAWHAFKGNRTNWSPTKRARAKTVKEYKRMVLNNEWTKYEAIDFIKRHYDEFCEAHRYQNFHLRFTNTNNQGRV